MPVNSPEGLLPQGSLLVTNGGLSGLLIKVIRLLISLLSHEREHIYIYRERERERERKS